MKISTEDLTSLQKDVAEIKRLLLSAEDTKFIETIIRVTLLQQFIDKLITPDKQFNVTTDNEIKINE